MNTQDCDDSKKAVYEDLRHLISLSESADKRGIWIPTWFRNRRALLLAGCVSVAVGGAGLAIQRPLWREPASPKTTLDRSTARVVESLSAERSRTADIPAAPPIAAPTPPASEAFIIRVGSFRDPSNAERMARSLRQRTINIRTEVVPASGMHVVTLGPFPQKGTAEDIARSVQAVTGLVPQVIRKDF